MVNLYCIKKIHEKNITLISFIYNAYQRII